MEPEEKIFSALYTYTKVLSVALEYRDLLTRLHSDRVRGLSEAIGVGCGLSKKELGILKVAASFHDIGKIGIPDQILLKPSPLDELELEKMKQHPEIGETILASTELEGSQQASLIIRHHHEHYNGLGYPDRLSGEEIPIYSRIISIADNYDAMAVTRSYHQSKTHVEIMAVMDKESGQKLDPKLMGIFRKIIASSKFRAPTI